MKLFTPFAIRGVELPNRVMLSPMCQYSAADGIANDWHLVHYGRFALGGFGLVMVEATAVSRDGRGTYGDIGLWNDIQAAPLAHIAGVLRANGSVPGIQLNHAGRKSSARRPWEGRGSLDAEHARIGEAPWDILAPSALPWADGWIVPNAMTEAQIEAMVENFAAAARRAISAGFDVIEIHSAHGYLLSEFLSPSSNIRTDHYGGSRENRMRFPLAVIERVRAVCAGPASPEPASDTVQAAEAVQPEPEALAALSEAAAQHPPVPEPPASQRRSAEAKAVKLGGLA